MDILETMLTDKATYWAPGDPPYQEGQRVWAEPVELSCRWEDRAELFVNAAGQEESSRSVVYVSEDVAEGGVLSHLELSAVPTDRLTDPLSSASPGFESWQIQKFDKLPTLDGDEWLRTAHL